MILTLIEHTAGEPQAPSLAALALGRQLGGQLDEDVEAIVIGAAGRAAAGTLQRHDVSRLHVAADPRLDDYAPEAWAATIAALLADAQPTALLAAAGDRAHEVLAHVAAMTGLALATNCQTVQPGEAFTVVRQRWGGSLLEEARLKGVTKLLTVAPGAFAAASAPVDACEVVDFTPSLPDTVFRVRAEAVPSAESAGISLADARLVIGGGRGVGSAEGFGALEALAGRLGAAVGCSRAVTSSGWRPHAEQIGQTGERITAELYIACGISGAMQHIVGAKGARHILAINTDADATIMQYADYAIIGDLHQVVPAILAEVEKAS